MMNERTKELVKQAGINLTPAQFSGVLEDEVDEFEVEKLIELIVRECADVANQHMEYNEGTDYNVGGKIKQHFGVEE